MRFLHSAPSHQYSVAVYGRSARRDGGQKDSCPPSAPPAHNAGARGYQTTTAALSLPTSFRRVENVERTRLARRTNIMDHWSA